MQRDTPPQAEPADHAAASWPEMNQGEGISTARKIRFAMLVVVLLAAIAVAVGVRVYRRRALGSALTDMRAALFRLDLRHAEACLKRAKKLYPEDRQADRLAVALYYAAGRPGLALGIFNSLDVRTIAAEIDPETLERARQAAVSVQLTAEEFDRTEIRPTGLQYLSDRGQLWNVARRVTDRGETDAEKALLLLRWLALHTLPTDSGRLPSSPEGVIWRGHGSPGQLAWTYAELARQAGLRCKVAVPSSADVNQCLVEVYPTRGEAFLVDPSSGVPLTDPASGRMLSLRSLAEDPAPYESLMALIGERSAYGADGFQTMQLKTAVHPYAFLLRFMVFEHVLADLRDSPDLAVGGSAQAEDVVPWTLPVEDALGLPTGEQRAARERADRSLRLIEPARRLHVQGLHAPAEMRYSTVAADLKEKLAQADIEEARIIVREALADLLFFRALNAYDGAATEAAEKTLREYLAEHPTGQWAVLAQTAVAEILSARGDTAGAEELWTELSGARRLYGALRLRGLLRPAADRDLPPSTRPPGYERGAQFP